MSEPTHPNILSAEWATEQFSRLSPQTQEDVRAVLAILNTKGAPAATKKLRALHVRREWPLWGMLALRDIIGTAWRRGLTL